MKKKPLTEKQHIIFKFIKRYQARHGYPPTRKEIMDNFGFKSLHTVTCHLALIEQKGWIQVTPKLSRGIKIK